MTSTARPEPAPTPAHAPERTQSGGVRLAVVGAHLLGQPLNFQLTDRGATLVEQTTTTADYRLFALDTEPPKPGLVRVMAGDPGAGPIEVEVWELGVAEFGSFVSEVPSPLAIGRVTLADGSDVSGFVCEPLALNHAPDITGYGGWRSFLSRDSTPVERAVRRSTQDR